MRVLSASEAITPAINRTKAVLFQPFQKGRSWKLAATAYLAIFGSVFVPTPLFFVGVPRQPGASGAMFYSIAVVIGLALTALMFLFFYIGARLQFVLFDIVLSKSKMVAPLWRKYGVCTWRWIGLKLCLSILVIFVSAVPLVSSFRYLITHAPTVPGQPPSPEFMSSFFLIYGVFVLVIGGLMLCSSLLNDFMLPSIVLENTSLTEAARRFFALIKAEPGEMAVYTIFKIVIAIAGGIAMEILILVVELIVAIPLGLIALLGWFLLHSLGPAGQVLLFAGGVVLFLIFFAFIFYVTIGFAGCVVIFFQAYSMYFLGGRYPLLGDLLEPPTPDFAIPVSAPPGPPPPAFIPS